MGPQGTRDSDRLLLGVLVVAVLVVVAALGYMALDGVCAENGGRLDGLRCVAP